MRILVLNPFGATEPFAQENLDKVKRSETSIVVENIRDVYPLNYNTYQYNIAKCANATAERIIKAEQEGFQGAIISCTADPGLVESRSVVDIPVLSATETSTSVALMMGRKFSIVATDGVWADGARALITKYGLWERCASVRHIGISARDLYPEFTPTRELERRIIDAATKCVKEDGAEVLIPGCTTLGAIITKVSRGRLSALLSGVPIIDPMVVTLKIMESMLELTYEVGYPAVSRVAMYKKPPKEEFLQLRRWLSENKSPEQRYYAGTPEPRRTPSRRRLKLSLAR